MSQQKPKTMEDVLKLIAAFSKLEQPQPTVNVGQRPSPMAERVRKLVQAKKDGKDDASFQSTIVNGKDLEEAQAAAKSQGASLVVIGYLVGGRVAILSSNGQGPGGSVVVDPLEALKIARKLVEVAILGHTRECSDPQCGYKQFLEVFDEMIAQTGPRSDEGDKVNVDRRPSGGLVN